MVVFRVEHAEMRYGPWCQHPETQRSLAPSNLLEANRMPCPWQETWTGPDRCSLQNYRHGFHSRNNFKRWFTVSDCRLLADCGFVLAKYRVPDTHVAKGSEQVIFDASVAEHLSDSPLQAVSR